MIENNIHIQKFNGASLRHALTQDVFDGKGDPYYRPLQTIMNMIDYQIWGRRPFGFHLTNLFFHLLSACLVFLVINKIFKNILLGLCTGLFFSIHPVVIEQLLIIAGRAELMSTAFILAGIFWALNNNLRSDLLALGAFVLACLSKENGVLMPIFLVSLGLLNKSWIPSWKRLSPYALLLIGYFIIRKAAISEFLPFPSLTQIINLLIRDFPSVLLHYTSLILFPTDLHSHRRLEFNSVYAFLSWISLIIAIYFCAVKKSRRGWFCLSWLIISFLSKIPNLIKSPLLLDHWGYLGSIAIFLILAILLTDILPRSPVLKKTSWAVLVFLILFWTGLSHVNRGHRNTDKKLYEWALRYPSSSIVRYNLGLIYLEEKNFEKAIPLFIAAKKMNPQHPGADNGIALALWHLRQNEKALTLLNNSIEEFPNYLPSYINRALVLRGPAGIQDLDYVLKQDPENLDAWKLMSELYFEKKNYSQAYAAVEQVLNLQPDDDKSLANAGVILVSIGKEQEGIRYLEKALLLNPGNEIAVKNLAVLKKK
jgi:tetratricopeptide (TPR) repeat protein